MKTYAFIDASNTLSTTKGVLKFDIDWKKMFNHLKSKKWNCKKIYFYQGEKKSNKHKSYLSELSKLGYEIRSKLTFIHKAKKQERKFVCKKCSYTNTVIFKKGDVHKANCDVELTVDAMNCAGESTRLLIFSGDGDFRYLIEDLLDKGAVIKLVSSTHKTKNQSSRFSTRLKDLIRQEEIRASKDNNKTRINFININDWRKKIKKA
ncbi:MAG: NYN domain-containing protein [Patescibacteria group bacterium]